MSRAHASITIQIESTGPVYDEELHPALWEMDMYGSESVRDRLTPAIENLFGESLDSLKVTATHSLVDAEAAA